LGVEHLGKQLQVTDRLADRDTELVRIDQPIKIAAGSHPFIGNPQQVAILTEQHSIKLARSLKKQIVVELVRPSPWAVRTSMPRRRSSAVTAAGT